MLNENKISEIKIIIEGLLKDIERLNEEEMVSHLKWEEILMSASLVTHKLNTLRIEQERNNMKRYLLIESAQERFAPINDELESLASSIKELREELLSTSQLNFNSLDREERVIKRSDLFEEDLKEKEIFIEESELEESPLQERSFIEEEPIEEIGEREENPLEEMSFVEEELLEMEEFEIERGDELPLWMKERVGPPIEDIHNAITLNDKLCFIRELFDGDTQQYRLSIDKLNQFDSLAEALNYTRTAFPQWDEESNAAIRFYTSIRRRFKDG